MKKYHSDSKSYNAIVEAMQQIRYNALVEQYGEDEMEEAYGSAMPGRGGLGGAMNTMAQGRLPAMNEEGDEEEMAEMSDEEEQMVAEMMDEALYEMDMEDDEDNLNEADDGRKARRRRRLRQALLIGAGLAAAAAPLAFAPKGTKYAGAPEGEGMMARSLRGAGNLATRYGAGVGAMGQAAGDAYTAGRERISNLDVSGLSGLIPKFGKGNK